MRRLAMIALTFVTAGIFSLSRAASDRQYWQFTLRYDSTGLRIAEAGQIPPTKKGIQTPGLESAPVRIGFDISWLDGAGAVITGTTTEVPIGLRAILPKSDGACQVIIPEAGVIVVRLVGPELASQPASVRLTRTAETQTTSTQFPIPRAFEFATRVIPIERIASGKVLRDGPLGCTKLRNTGPDDNRVVFAIIGDGYTQANIDAGLYTTAADNLVTAFGNKPPWDVLLNATNIYRIDVVSNEEGADNDPLGTLKDTYLNSSFWVGGVERGLDVDVVGAQRAVDAADNLIGYGLWDYLIVIVNSTKYGGTGGGNRAVTSVHELGNEVALHEVGHSIARLADEYSTPYPGYPSGDWEPNVDFDFSGSGLKWLPWVEAGTPLPTPNDSAYVGVVGAFEGARYLSTGIYRPWHSCIMRVLNNPFDPVCAEAHITRFVTLVNMADSVAPTIALPVPISFTGTRFAISPLPLGPMTYVWKIGDSVLPQTDSAITIKSGDLYKAHLAGTSALQVKVIFPTPLMRLTIAQRTFPWTIFPDCNGNGVSDSTDLSLNTSHDSDHNGIPDECDLLACCVGKRGNVNASGIIDLTDLGSLVSYLTGAPIILACPTAANVDGKGIVDSADLSALVSYLTGGGFVLPNCP